MVQRFRPRSTAKRRPAEGDWLAPPDLEVAQFETSILKAGNELGIGTMGLGGDTTLLDVHIETAGTHTACLPIAISFGCWANRVAAAELKGQRFKVVR